MRDSVYKLDIAVAFCAGVAVGILIMVIVGGL